jgi:hypothetical protein
MRRPPSKPVRHAPRPVEGARKVGGWPLWVTPELVRETIRVWQPYYTEPLSEADAASILLNVGRLAAVLQQGASS